MKPLTILLLVLAAVAAALVAFGEKPSTWLAGAVALAVSALVVERL